MDQKIVGRAEIKVLGVGGAGGNAVNNMIREGLEGVDFIAANTDFQSLAQSLADTKIQLGVNLTRGLGAGGNPEVGSKAAAEDQARIRQAVEGSDMVFITAGMGGGTGTGAAPVAAQICRQMEILTVAVVTKPFSLEGKVRHRNADIGLQALKEVVDTLIVIPNDRLFALAGQKATFLEMFKWADSVLLYAVKGVADLVTQSGYINVDFADLKTVMSAKGMAVMGIGSGEGENRALNAAKQAISSPFLEDISIRSAKAALINISAGLDFEMQEFDDIASSIHKEMDDETNIITGLIIDEELQGKVRVTVIATGIEGKKPVEDSRVKAPRRPGGLEGYGRSAERDFIPGMRTRPGR